MNYPESKPYESPFYGTGLTPLPADEEWRIPDLVSPTEEEIEDSKYEGN